MDSKPEISISANVDKLARELLATKCLKFGTFTLKSGAMSSYYIDIRESTMYPTLFHLIVEAITSFMSQFNDALRLAIAGIPYGVVPIASAVAYQSQLPYYPVRKEIKSYGNKIDSDLFNDYNYVLIEDVMSTGSSIIETIRKLEGKKVTDVIVVVDRESGGETNLKAQYPDIRLHSIIKASQLLEYNPKNN